MKTEKTLTPNCRISKPALRLMSLVLPVETYPRAIYPITEYGQGVEPDLTKAIAWYQKAA
ncbi:SEL1-like repeat protein, partial [Gilliamella sp. B2717]|uniref:SEL1-like repeat protein n=1 Tax=Gilliamella sp. B2717 TaxID=2817996 RepID=UPI003A5CD153